MKKALIYGLSAALLLSSLTACGKPQADQQTTEPEPPQIQATIPEAETTPEPEPEEIPATPEPLSETVPVESDEIEDSQAPEETAPPELFTEVSETVYATGTVNLRSGPSTDDEKVGSLSKGQSITRTGIGTGDYSSWSRAELADGSIVYVASSYLTTTKPTTQSNTQQNGGGAQNTTPGTQSGGQIYDVDEGPIVRNPTAGMTPEEAEAAGEIARQETQKDIDATKGIMY